MSELTEAIELLRWKLDDDPCITNRRGECETHGNMKGGGCWMVRARQAVARYDEPEPVDEDLVTRRMTQASPPGFVYQDGAYICQACGCLCPDSWTILQAHKDFHDALAEALPASLPRGLRGTKPSRR